MRTPSIVVGCLLASVARAAPAELAHQGRIFDSTGAAIDGPVDLDFALYDSPTGGVPLWQESHAETADNGYFSVQLGSTNPLDVDDFDGSVRYLGMAVDGGAEAGRIPIVSVPYALRAASAESLTGAVSYDDLTDVPPDADTLAALGCSSGDIATFLGGSWSCGAPNAHAHPAADTTSGVFDVARLPVGGTSATVAAGDHTHVADDITGGTLSVNLIPVGTTSSTVSRGDHGHTAAEVGALPDSGGSLSGDLSVSGFVGVGSAGDGDCGSAAPAGSLRYAAGALELCDGTEWVGLAAVAGDDGTSAASPGQSCKTILVNHPASVSGPYWIVPPGYTGAAFPVYCDMTYDGGGWTKVMNLVTGTDLSSPGHVNEGGAWTTEPKGANAGKIPTAAWESLWSHREFMMRVDSPADSTFIGNGAGHLRWQTNGADWPSWGTGQRPTDYSLFCDKTGDGVTNETQHYTTDNRSICNYHGQYWMYDHNYTGDPQCYGFETDRFGSNLHFCGTTSATSAGGGGNVHNTAIYVRD